MDLNLLALGTSLFGGMVDTSGQAAATNPDEFQNILEMTQAPPGPEPPPPNPDASGEKELQTQESNTQSNKPDLSSTDKTQSSSDKDKKTSQVHAIATGVAVVQPMVLIGAANATNALPTGGKATAKGTATGPDIKTAAGTTPAATATPTAKASPTLVSLKELPTDASATIVSAQSTTDPTTAQPATTTPAPTGTIDSPLPIAIDPTAAPAVNPQIGTNIANQQIQAALATAKDSGFAMPNPTSSSNSTPSVPAAPSVQNNIIQAQQATNSGSQTAGGNAGGAQSGNNNQTAQQNAQQLTNIEAIKEFVDHADKLALTKAAENVTVHLQTEDNTSITLNVKSSHGEIAAQIVTNNESLRNALHQNRGQLNHSFENKGMNLGQVSVGLNGQGKQQRPSQQQQFNTGATSSSAKETTTSTPGSFPTASAGKGVDLSI
ncbi:MAG TPA: flagellar hook-length control protein FliK [Fimbriimonadaceae bacterium]|jgi:flagellar hook-length control protein FliK